MMGKPMGTWRWTWCALALGCNAFDASPGGEPERVDPGSAFGGNGAETPTSLRPEPRPSVMPSPPAVPQEPMQAPRRFDDRPVLQPAQPPPPIEGGTLLLSADETLAIVSDPDRDRVVVVEVADAHVLHTLPMEPGDVPGRLVEDAAGRVHVVMRRAGAVVRIAPREGTVLGRAAACGVPRGIAYRQATDSVLVACASGELVELAAGDGAHLGTRQVEPDLQDVLVTEDGGLRVSTFKRAELLTLDADGSVAQRMSPNTLVGPFEPIDGGPQTLEPAVAWRVTRAGDGQVMMVHQRAQTEPIQLPSEDDDGVQGGYGGGDGGPGTAGCSAIVQSGVTFMHDDGTVRSLPPLGQAVLPVDGAVSADGRRIAVAVAGPPSDPDAVTQGPDQGGVVYFNREEPVFDNACIAPGILNEGAIVPVGQALGVAFDSKGRLLIQTRDPSELVIHGGLDACPPSGCDAEVVVAMGGTSVRDTGHDLFHLDAGLGVACASCHPAGLDDGRTWAFSPIGSRRTQLFNMGVRGSEPLHWDGDMDDFEHLVEQVFVRRMGGAEQSGPRVLAMADWIETLQTLPPLRGQDDPAVQRGKALFESAEVGCGGCHSGALLTNNESVDVGTGGAFQVPSLVNVAYHQPYMHTGCAATLRERFEPGCGGDQHGQTDHLAATDIDDLVAYLESL